MKKNSSGGIWTLATRMASNHDNHYTTRHLILLSTEYKLNTTFAGHSRKEVLNIEQMKGMLFWQFK